MSTYEPIASQTLGSTASSVTFSSIPQGYTDIRVVVVTAVNTATYMRFNSDSGSNYSLTEIWAGTSPISERAASVSRIDLRNSSSTLGNNMATVDIMSYSNSTTYKTLLTAIRDGLYDRVYRQVQLWRNTSAITTITFTPDSGTFPSGSTFSLYGIQVGDKAQKAQGGNIVVSSGGYMYHAFTTSGSFIPSEPLSGDILVIGGGGGGGQFHGGGGGGGAIEGSSFFQTQSLIAKNYLVSIGAGGAGGTGGGKGNNGQSSVFYGASTITALGGGGGGSAYVNPSAGGSGGGAGQAGHSGGTASGSNTNAGGNTSGSNQIGAGGGGATAAGSNGSGSSGGAGGQGKTLTTIDANFSALGFTGIVASSGGGGGASGGSAASGGTGAGNGTNNDTKGGNATSFGSGGGGGGYNTGNGGEGGNGYSGLVIIRYAV